MTTKLQGLRPGRGEISIGRWGRLLGLVLGLACVSVSPAFGLSFIDAEKAYEDRDYPKAALFFQELLATAKDSKARGKAEFFLAQSLLGAGYYLPAYQYFGRVYNSGETHPYFLPATSGLLTIAKEIGDDVLIPELISRGYTEAFRKLQPESLLAINYMVGLVSQRRQDYAQAKQFLGGVRPESSYYLRARYLLGILAVKAAEGRGAKDYSEAIGYFNEIEKALDDSDEDGEKKLYRVALLGKARAYYSQGEFKKSIQYYEKIPRFSDDWYDAMYESGWAYFQNARFGRALGMVHSILSPYFDDRYRAEAWILKSTVYFQMCHFDRVRRTLGEFFRIHEPIGLALKAQLSAKRPEAEIVALIDQGEPGFPETVRLRIRNNRRFQKFSAQIQEAKREIERARTEFPKGTFRTALLRLLDDAYKTRVSLTAKLIQEQLGRESAWLDNFVDQARIIKFESTDAERKVLEAGKDLHSGPRGRGARPFVPNAKFQHWAHTGEYWLDELGYYEYAIASECLAP